MMGRIVSGWILAARRPDWARELDFVGPRFSPSPWSWLALLLGLLAWGAILPQVQQLDVEQQEAQAVLKRLQRAEHQQAVMAKAPASHATPAEQAPGLSAESARHAAQMAQWLGYPWLAVLSQAEDAAKAEGAVMLGLSLDLATLGSKADVTPDVRLSAAVRDDASALRWVQAQGPSAQLLSRERLSTPFVAASGPYDWRAEAVIAGGTP